MFGRLVDLYVRIFDGLNFYLLFVSYNSYWWNSRRQRRHCSCSFSLAINSSNTIVRVGAYYHLAARLRSRQFVLTPSTRSWLFGWILFVGRYRLPIEPLVKAFLSKNESKLESYELKMVYWLMSRHNDNVRKEVGHTWVRESSIRDGVASINVEEFDKKVMIETSYHPMSFSWNGQRL